MRVLAALTTLCGLLVFARGLAAAADDATPLAAPLPASPLQAVVTTSNDERIETPLSALADGKLTLGTDPPRTIDLADLSRIELGKITAPAGDEVVWIGQDNHDLVQVGGTSGGNGVQDLHLRALKLKPQALKQLMVVCRFPNQLRVWRLDTSQSPHWRLAIARSETSPEADLYIEPGNLDSHGLPFELTFTYADGSTSKATVNASTHTSDQHKVDRGKQPGQAPKEMPAATNAQSEVYLIDAGHLRGEIVELDAESLLLRARWKAEMRIPLVHVKAIWFGNSLPTSPRSDLDKRASGFDKQLSEPAADDVVFLIAPDKSAAQVAGNVQKLAEGRLHMRFEGDDRSVKQDRLLGLVFAAHPKPPSAGGLSQTLALGGGDSLSGRWIGLPQGGIELETPWQAKVTVPAETVSEIRFRGGRVTYLSDLDPSTVEEVGYFGRILHWRRDQGFDEGPAKVKGQELAHSVGMHSRSILTYQLDGEFEKFKATVGFDDSGGGRGRAVCRVLVDGRESFAEKDLRADGQPVAVEVSLAGAKQLTLEVDFGAAEDTGDRVIWGDPRLFRTEKK